jgi:hypothetical protein
VAGHLKCFGVLTVQYSTESVVSGWKTVSFGVLTGAVQCRDCCE